MQRDDVSKMCCDVTTFCFNATVMMRALSALMSVFLALPHLDSPGLTALSAFEHLTCLPLYTILAIPKCSPGSKEAALCGK